MNWEICVCSSFKNKLHNSQGSRIYLEIMWIMDWFDCLIPLFTKA